MTSYQELSKYRRKFLAMTGYSVEEFEALLPSFQAQFEAYVKSHKLNGKPRCQRRYTDYKNSVLPTIEDKLLFILIYLKQGQLQEAHASLFGMHQPDANKWIHLLHPLLNQTLATLAELPTRHAAELESELEQALAEDDQVQLMLFFHDGTERPIVRPKDPEAQKLYYSGKKKQHTVKNIVLINARCKIIFLTQTCEGKKHDKRATDEAAYHLPEGSTLYQDTGFQGFTLAGVTIIQPKKKPQGIELTADDKANNRLISKIRIRIEHAIGGVKRYRIVKDKIRNWKNNFRDQVMETCCGLHNFRLNFRPWHYDTLQI
jgi:hypothetical protein